MPPPPGRETTETKRVGECMEMEKKMRKRFYNVGVRHNIRAVEEEDGEKGGGEMNGQKRR